MPGTKRKPIAFSYEEIKNGLLSIPNKEDRFMLAVSYANGTRVSEVIGIKKGDIDVTDEFISIATPVKKKRGNVVPLRAPPISKKLEPWLADIIVDYVKENNGALISYSKRTAQRRFEKYFHCTSHSFRHTRATHCFTKLRMSMRMVAEYFRIAPVTLNDWVMRYGHLDKQDIEQHLRRIENVGGN